MPTTPRDPQKIFIGLPSYDGTLRLATAKAVMELATAKTGYKFIPGFLANVPVNKARNFLTWAARAKTDAAKILFIDADIIHEPAHVLRLLSHEGKRIIGGIYAFKQLKMRWVVNELPDHPDGDAEVRRVKEFGMGFSLWDLSVFDEMEAAHPEIAYESDDPEFAGATLHDFFSMGVVNRRYLTEDYYAQHRARALGIDCWVDTGCQVQHEGMIRFPILEANTNNRS